MPQAIGRPAGRVDIDLGGFQQRAGPRDAQQFRLAGVRHAAADPRALASVIRNAELSQGRRRRRVVAQQVLDAGEACGRVVVSRQADRTAFYRGGGEHHRHLGIQCDVQHPCALGIGVIAKAIEKLARAGETQPLQIVAEPHVPIEKERDGSLCDEQSPSVLDPHHALTLEIGESLPYGEPADPEPSRQLQLGLDLAARQEPARLDVLPYRRRDPLR